MIPYGRQEITEEDIREVEKVLRSEYLTQGPTVPLFEKSIAKYCNSSHAVAVNSATSALHISCLALGLGPGDNLWTSANTFIASSNCALYCGANIDFVDIDPQTSNISIEALSKKLSQAESNGKLPKILIPVHLAGQPCDMISIKNLSKKYGFKIIEDASHAIGASYHGYKVGSCAHSDITVFSFHPVKIITTGEGGMALTNDSKIAERLKRLRMHGITNDKLIMADRPNNEIWNYQQIELGFNYRMTDIQAAIGLSQIKRLDQYIKSRHEIAKIYKKNLSHLPFLLPFEAPNTYSSYHLYPIRILENSHKKNQKDIYHKLLKLNVGVNIHYIPVHRHPYYEGMGFKENDFPQAEKFHREAISLPIYPSLSIEEQLYVIDILQSEFR